MFFSDGLVLIIGPSVSEVVFNLLFEFDLNRSTGVETLDEAEPSRQHLALVDISIQALDGDQDLDEDTHDVREDGHSDEQDERAD